MQADRICDCIVIMRYSMFWAETTLSTASTEASPATNYLDE
jgi:hypothetical protein